MGTYLKDKEGFPPHWWTGKGSDPWESSRCRGGSLGTRTFLWAERDQMGAGQAAEEGERGNGGRGYG